MSRLTKLIGSLWINNYLYYYGKDGSLSYFIKRFDRHGKEKNGQQKYFAQLTGNTRDTNTVLQWRNSFRYLTNIVHFLLSKKLIFFLKEYFFAMLMEMNMHSKNFSLITKNGKTTLSPIYDFLNSTIAIKNPDEDTALSLKGKKSNLKSVDFIDYYAKEKLQLKDQIKVTS